MKTKVMMLDDDSKLGEVDNFKELISLLEEHQLTPDDIWFTIPNNQLWDRLIDYWGSKHQETTKQEKFYSCDWSVVRGDLNREIDSV